MQPKLINGKTLTISSGGLKASKTSNILSLLHLKLKIFTLQLVRNCYQNVEALLKEKYKLQKMTRKSYTI